MLLLGTILEFTVCSYNNELTSVNIIGSVWGSLSV